MPNNQYDWIVTPYFERISDIIPLPYYVSWLLISQVIFLFYYLTLVFFTLEDFITTQFLISESLITLMIGAIASAVIFFSKAMEDFTAVLPKFINQDEDKIIEWYTTEIRSAFDDKKMIMSGIVMGISLVILALNLEALVYPSIQVQSFFLFVIFLLGLVSGGIMNAQTGIARIIYKFGDMPLRISLYQHPSASIKAAGKLLYKISLASILLYIIGIAYVYFRIGFEGFLITAVMVAVGLWTIGYFIVPQLKIHEIMKRCKNDRIRQFSEHLESALEVSLEKPTKENVNHVKELMEVQKKLDEMNEWPFDAGIFISLLSVIIIPILISLFEAWLNG